MLPFYVETAAANPVELFLNDVLSPIDRLLSLLDKCFLDGPGRSS